MELVVPKGPSFDSSVAKLLFALSLELDRLNFPLVNVSVIGQEVSRETLSYPPFHLLPAVEPHPQPKDLFQLPSELAREGGSLGVLPLVSTPILAVLGIVPEVSEAIYEQEVIEEKAAGALVVIVAELIG
jgi:hypothetical protein